MPATLTAAHVPAGTAAAEVCADCRGLLVTVDDGSFTGFVGELVPCGCAVLRGAACACQIIDWPLNDGFTGWIELSSEELYVAPEDAPILRACPEHNDAARAACRGTGA